MLLRDSLNRESSRSRFPAQLTEKAFGAHTRSTRRAPDGIQDYFLSLSFLVTV